MSSPRSSSDTPRSSARAAALAVLLACQSGEKTLDDETEKRASEFRLDARDRALAMELAYGVLRRLEFIDWRLAPILQKPLARLPIAIQMLARMGAYQLLYLDRIPASAAVNESVSLAKSYAARLKRDWSGLVNAVLRNLIRIPEPALPDPAIDPAHTFSIRYSVPLWLCQRWIERLGLTQAEAACRSASEVPALTLRVNRLRATREHVLDRCRQAGVVAAPSSISPVGLVLEKSGSVTSLPGFPEGDFYVEDEAAQLIPPILDPQPGDLVLDACAAPGGKATHLAELMKNQGRIVAMDRHKARLDLLRDNCRRLGLTIVRAVTGDARRHEDLSWALRQVDRQQRSSDAVGSGFADRILLDAPCSGLGVLRRHPEAKWQKHQDMFRRHHDLQIEILTAVSAVLRPGGVLVYSTCSTEREETEDVVECFCRTHPGWARESVEPWLPSAALSCVTARGALSTMGNICGMDGFYAARLRKIS
ncbi:MAG: 16S rRNA (cytosine(967)-C(5))-methyltransferase RsmB [Nitrospira sp.]|nr:16S rRNA (cytosine(967)-C(5))-methyltransferase RsmB [Nitrospira sp.]